MSPSPYSCCYRKKCYCWSLELWKFSHHTPACHIRAFCCLNCQCWFYPWYYLVCFEQISRLVYSADRECQVPPFQLLPWEENFHKTLSPTLDSWSPAKKMVSPLGGPLPVSWWADVRARTCKGRPRRIQTRHGRPRWAPIWSSGDPRRQLDLERECGQYWCRPQHLKAVEVGLDNFN